MDPHGPIAKRFPLVARFRPACLPLPARVRALVDLAGTAGAKGDQVLGSAVYNQAALVASDLGLPGLAREMCHQHADAYLDACPLPGMSAIRGLEPIVNLARLQIRAGHTDDGRQRLLDLYEAVDTGTAAQFEGITVPANLTATAEDRQKVRAWLWRVLLADGTRTLTATGRWAEALRHIEQHRGVGQRMLDGRQVAVLAAMTTGHMERAEHLLAETTPGDPWEQAVTACLTALCHCAAKKLVKHQVSDLVSHYLGRGVEPGMNVFDARLGLTVLDVIGSAENPAARRVVAELHRRTTEANDGHAARESLAHPLFTALASNRETQDCRELVLACALGAAAFPDELYDELHAALHVSDRVIRDSVASFGQ
ncbi:hypothetical protein ACFYYH_08665 [Streptomyces sp. NPDC002018]|uniref:hypothetical protein n=1 Tax=Streptomyces sp. NPDC002018 TaxID=3364629 RepID=UPI0036849E6C